MKGLKAKDVDPITIDDRELFEHYRFEVDKGQTMLRIDKFLMGRLENVSRSKIQNAAKAGNIIVNNLPVKQNYKVKPLDTISVVWTEPPRELDLIAEDIPLNIVFEDDDILVINKPAGLVVHPGYNNFTGTMLNALKFYLEPQTANNQDTAPFLVHRIDKDTSGIILVTKNELAQARMAKQFFDHTIERKYNALVWGDFEEETGTITGHVGRSVKDRRVMAVYPGGETGKHAVTHYRVLERFGYVTLIECILETGRTHQIRAHMKYTGHPLFNDEVYGGDKIIKGTTFTKYKQFVDNCFTLLPRQALHAKSLGFEHPTTGKFVMFDSDLPADMEAAIEKWRGYSKNKDIYEV